MVKHTTKNNSLKLKKKIEKTDIIMSSYCNYNILYIRMIDNFIFTSSNDNLFSKNIFCGLSIHVTLYFAINQINT